MNGVENCPGFDSKFSVTAEEVISILIDKNEEAQNFLDGINYGDLFIKISGAINDSNVPEFLLNNFVDSFVFLLQEQEGRASLKKIVGHQSQIQVARHIAESKRKEHLKALVSEEAHIALEGREIINRIIKNAQILQKKLAK